MDRKSNQIIMNLLRVSIARGERVSELVKQFLVLLLENENPHVYITDTCLHPCQYITWRSL